MILEKLPLDEARYGRFKAADKCGCLLSNSVLCCMQGGIVSERYGTSIATLTGTEQTAASQEAVAHASQQHTYDESGNHASERQTHQSHFRGGSSRNAGHDSGQYSSRQNNRVGAGEPGLYKAQHDAVDLDRGNARGSSRGRKQGRGRAGRGTSTH